MCSSTIEPIFAIFLERASARETVARTAVGSFAKQLLAPFGIRIMGYIRSLGGITANLDGLTYGETFERSEESPVRTADKERRRKNDRAHRGMQKRRQYSGRRV